MADDISDLEAGLLPIEPLPLTETPSNTNDNDEKNAASSPQHTSHLGLSHHSPAWWLHRIQKYSSYVFSAFAVAHIANTALIPLATRSVPASEPYLLLTRPYYQGLPAEPLLIALPLASHVAAGLALRVYRRNQHARRYGDASSAGNRARFLTHSWPPVSGISKLGFALTPLLLGHVYINRVVPETFPSGASNVNLSYVSHAFARHPALSAVGFAALVAVGSFHVVWGWAKWLGWTPAQTTDVGGQRALTKKRRWYVVNAAAAATTALWLAGAFGVIAKGGEAPGWVGRLYDEMYRSIPIFGRWM